MNAPIRARLTAEAVVWHYWPALYSEDSKIDVIGPRTYVITDRQDNATRAWMGRHGDLHSQPAEPEDANIRDALDWFEALSGQPLPYGEVTRDVELLLDDEAWASVRVTFDVRLVDAVEWQEVWALHWRLEGQPRDEAREIPPELPIDEHDAWICDALLDEENTPHPHDPWR